MYRHIREHIEESMGALRRAYRDANAGMFARIFALMLVVMTGEVSFTAGKAFGASPIINSNVILIHTNTFKARFTNELVKAVTNQYVAFRITNVSRTNNIRALGTNFVMRITNVITNMGSVSDRYIVKAMNMDGYAVSMKTDTGITGAGLKVISVETLKISGPITNITYSTSLIWSRSEAYSGIGSYEQTNIVVQRILPPLLGGFRINHQGLATKGSWTWVEVEALDVLGNRMRYYNGTVTLDTTTSNAGMISWNNGSGAGVFNNIGAGEMSYRYSGAVDGGLVTLWIRDMSIESLYVKARSGMVQTNSKSLMFDFLNPYLTGFSIKVKEPEINNYATVRSASNIEVRFSRYIGNIWGNEVRVIDETLGVDATVVSRKVTNNTIVLKLGLTNNRDELKRYRIIVGTNIQSTNNLPIIDNPFIAAYSNGYEGEFLTLIDARVGANISTNLKGAMIPDNIRVEIGPNALNRSSWIEVREIPSGSDSGVEEADMKAQRNEYIEPVVGFGMVFEIKGNDDRGASVSVLAGSAKLIYEYADNIEVIDENNLQIYWYDDSRREWIWISEAKVSSESNRIEINIDRVGKFRIVESVEDKSEGEDMIVYPNPLDMKDGKSAVIKFYLKGSAKVWIKIYDITGKAVRVLLNGDVFNGPRVYNGEIRWDGKNGEGVDIVSGVYIIKYKAEYIGTNEVIDQIWKQGIIR